MMANCPVMGKPRRTTDAGLTQSSECTPVCTVALPRRGCPRFVPGVGWRRCCRPKCSRVCRHRWGQRRARAFRRGLATSPPNLFVTLRRVKQMDAAALRLARAKGVKALRRRRSGSELCWVCEWSRRAGYHEHLLVRTMADVDEVRRLFQHHGAEATVQPIRVGWEASVMYSFKALKNPRKWAAPPPQGFRGPLFGTTRRFLGAPLAQLLRFRPQTFAIKTGHQTRVDGDGF